MQDRRQSQVVTAVLPHNTVQQQSSVKILRCNASEIDADAGRNVGAISRVFEHFGEQSRRMTANISVQRITLETAKKVEKELDEERMSPAELLRNILASEEEEERRKAGENPVPSGGGVAQQGKGVNGEPKSPRSTRRGKGLFKAAASIVRATVGIQGRQLKSKKKRKGPGEGRGDDGVTVVLGVPDARATEVLASGALDTFGGRDSLDMSANSTTVACAAPLSGKGGGTSGNNTMGSSLASSTRRRSSLGGIKILTEDGDDSPSSRSGARSAVSFTYSRSNAGAGQAGRSGNDVHQDSSAPSSLLAPGSSGSFGSNSSLQGSGSLTGSARGSFAGAPRKSSILVTGESRKNRDRRESTVTFGGQDTQVFSKQDTIAE
ncbi:unnamed protein product [Amoebophrya sp. A25]|nr:unnamed protein product [Amoebophrya sp. A25]|eukprot:GSA25T00001784001.1